MPVTKHRVYVAPEGETLDHNSPHVDIPMPKCEVTLPDDMGDQFPNPYGLVFKPITVTWQPPAGTVSKTYKIGVSQIEDGGDPGPMGQTTRTFESEETPVVDE